MFSIDCNPENGFDIQLDNTCRQERFPNVPEQSEMIVVSNDLVENPGKIEDFGHVKENCLFNITGEGLNDFI